MIFDALLGVTADAAQELLSVNAIIIGRRPAAPRQR